MYGKFDVDIILAKGGIGFQNILLEQWPTHLCNLFYSDLRLVEIHLEFESNSKSCRIPPPNVPFLDKIQLHFNSDSVSPEFDYYSIEERNKYHTPAS